MPTVEVHVLSHDHEPMLEWALRHYATFADKVVIHDGGPTEIDESPSTRTALKYARDGWLTVRWDTQGQLNDELAMKLKNECWLGTDADWVICADVDELIYFPGGAERTLEAYDRIGAAVIKPHGYEMFSDKAPPDFGQIYDHVKMGARDDKWYAKPILFSPQRVLESGFGIGAHESNPVLMGGRALHVGKDWPQANPPTYLLHCHQIGPIEDVAARYDATRTRLAAINEKNRWGNFKSGLVHAQEKRDLILPRLERVIA